MLKTKCIKDKPSLDDGERISVMSRHTLCDGETPDPEITLDSYDGWDKELAPTTETGGKLSSKRDSLGKVRARLSSFFAG